MDSEPSPQSALSDELISSDNETWTSTTPDNDSIKLILSKTSSEDWIKANPKKRPASTQVANKQLKKCSLNLQNRFQALENQETDLVVGETTTNTVAKPPPIFIPIVLHFQKLLDTLDNVAKNEYSCKLIGNDQVKILSTSPTSYRNIVKKLVEQNTSFHTYQLKQERKYRVVLRNMHYSVDIEELKQEIESHGHKVANIHNIQHRIKKTPLSMFYVDLFPAENNKDIFNITYLQYSVVTFEAPHVKRQIVQCARCQRYGHTKAYCFRQPRCVKCGKNHLTKECDKENDTDATCALCKGTHPANYKGCSVYKDLQKRKYPPIRPRQHYNAPNNIHAADLQQNFIQPGVSYAQMTNNNNNNNSYHNSNNNPNNFNNNPNNNNNYNNNNKLEDMMMKLMERMDTMLNLLTTLVTKIN